MSGFTSPARIAFVGMVLAALIPSDNAAAQVHRDLPRPDSSRSPTITRIPPDSIRKQVVYLHAFQLLQNVQANDGTSIEGDVSGLTWGPLDTVSMTDPRCLNLRAALSLYAESTGASRLSIFFDGLRVSDSGNVQVVTGLVELTSSKKVPLALPIKLVFDPRRGRWVRIEGLLSAVCSSAKS